MRPLKREREGRGGGFAPRGRERVAIFIFNKTDKKNFALC